VNIQQVIIGRQAVDLVRSIRVGERADRRPVGLMATTEARFTPWPFKVTRPEMEPKFAVQLAVPYSTEIAAMSSASSGRARVVLRMTSCDMALAVQVCCNPSACPIS